MPSDGEFDTDRVAVKTYVPASQKDAWTDAAEDLNMSQSEFVRTMVQAGRRKFTIDEEPASDHSNPGGDGLEDRVLDILDGEGPIPFDDLVETLVESMTDDMEERLEDAIETLQDDNRIRHAPRKGYALSEGNR